MIENKPTVALIYDFDKTLSPKDMQAFGYIDKLGIEEELFWQMSNDISQEFKADRILSYMYLMIKTYKEKGIKLTRDYFVECGKNIQLFDGVETWFNRINQIGDDLGVKVEHYVVSSGLKEMIEGTSIAKYFKEIYAGYFIYENNEPIWPAFAINYTNKTQFIYRISKGLLNVNDERVNDRMSYEQRPVPFSHMIYIGDSGTDIPCMRLIAKSGGYAIGVYQEQGKGKKYLESLLCEDRINYIAPANYEKNSELEKIVTAIMQSIKCKDTLKQINKLQKNVSK